MSFGDFALATSFSILWTKVPFAIWQCLESSDDPSGIVRYMKMEQPRGERFHNQTRAVVEECVTAIDKGQQSAGAAGI